MIRNLRPRILRVGFTLIELLVASVLTSLLLVAVLSVVRITTREQKPTRTRPSQQLLTLLRADFTNARWIRTLPMQVELAGPIATNSEHLGLQTLAQVTYSSRSIKIGETSTLVLMREESSATRNSKEPLWLGVSSLAVESDLIDDPLEDEIPDELKRSGWTSLASTLRIGLLGTDGSPIITETILRD